MKRYLLLIILIIALIAVWFMPEITALLNRQPDEAWARMKQTGVLRFAINPTYMPFDGLGSQGDFFGIDVEIAQEIARRLGARAEFVIAGFDSLYDVLRVGQADATISALPIDPAKFGTWRYSESYFDAGMVLVERDRPPGSPKTSEVSIAVEYGSDADAAARYLARRHEGVEIKYTQSAVEALNAAADGWTDAALVDGVSARQLLPKYPGLQIAEQITHDPYAIAVWGNSTQLLNAINATLADLKQNGTIQQIIDEWMKR